MVMCPPKERDEPSIRSHLGHSTPLVLPSGCAEHMNGDALVGDGEEWYCDSEGVVDAIGLFGEGADCGNCFEGEGER
jgi:hypothetical protein